MHKPHPAYKEVSEVAQSQRHTIRHEQPQRADLGKQLAQALKAPKTTPPLSPQDSRVVADAWAAHHLAELLQIENEPLRRHRDEVAHERERIANRILRLMSPGQYFDHATQAGYDPTKDRNIHQKPRELRVLHNYSRYQKKFMKRVTARKLKENRPIDEQAIEATLADRRKLITKPPVALGSEPQWVITGFLLDDRGEAFPHTQSEERCKRMEERMGNWWQGLTF